MSTQETSTSLMTLEPLPNEGLRAVMGGDAAPAGRIPSAVRADIRDFYSARWGGAPQSIQVRTTGTEPSLWNQWTGPTHGWDYRVKQGSLTDNGEVDATGGVYPALRGPQP
jgi:hypothetical protein